MPFFRNAEIVLFPNNPVGEATNSIWLCRALGVNLTVSPQQASARVRNRRGFLTTAAQEVTAEEYTCQIGFEELRWNVLELLNNQMSTSEPGVSLPQEIYGVVPSTPHTVSNAGFVAANAATTRVSITNKGSWGPPRSNLSVSAVADSADPDTVEIANGSITFDSSYEGADYFAQIFKSYTVRSLGVTTNPTYIGEMSLWFKAMSDEYPDGCRVHVPRLTRATETAPMDFNQAPVSAVLQFGIITQTNNPMPWRIYNMNDAVAA